MSFLSIAIPTYNRVLKLERILNIICKQITSSPLLLNNVEVIVSNNASIDSTENFLCNFNCGNVKFRYFTQPANLGLDGNMRFLYQISSTKYIWFFSDDDILLPGSLMKVLETLVEISPDILLFSIEQPIGSKARTFDFPAPVTVFNDPETMIKLLLQFPKLSIYVLKKTMLSDRDLQVLSGYLGTDYDFIAVCYSILQQSHQPMLCVISNPLATCDLEFNRIRLSPATWGRGWAILTHPYVRKHAPHLEKIWQRLFYYSQIQVLFAIKIGSLIAENLSEYDEFITKLEVKFFWLLQRPKSLIQLLFLKLKLTIFWPMLRKIIRFR